MHWRSTELLSGRMVRSAGALTYCVEVHQVGNVALTRDNFNSLKPALAKQLQSQVEARVHPAPMPRLRGNKKSFNCSTLSVPSCHATHEGGTRAGILPGCPGLNRGSREGEVGFEPRTTRKQVGTIGHRCREAIVHLYFSLSLLSSNLKCAARQTTRIVNVIPRRVLDFEDRLAVSAITHFHTRFHPADTGFPEQWKIGLQGVIDSLGVNKGLGINFQLPVYGEFSKRYEICAYFDNIASMVACFRIFHWRIADLQWFRILRNASSSPVITFPKHS
ncbi:hypothetical protein T265_10386 [Opisthorchis viverrini]|uniref:Uncharacterized protein n=1 Tax=Opisthorchis viverrini TaxID=6198 RepID=A0A075A1G7_OPIVI|nr:hypothetical protein T265_10386 [Opisthorchis viverrini]KER21224.1 hypothetical protein T265_10386 [Opisthorchis viverrini]